MLNITTTLSMTATGHSFAFIWAIVAATWFATFASSFQALLWLRPFQRVHLCAEGVGPIDPGADGHCRLDHASMIMEASTSARRGKSSPLQVHRSCKPLGLRPSQSGIEAAVTVILLASRDGRSFLAAASIPVLRFRVSGRDSAPSVVGDMSAASIDI